MDGEVWFHHSCLESHEALLFRHLRLFHRGSTGVPSRGTKWADTDGWLRLLQAGRRRHVPHRLPPRPHRLGHQAQLRDANAIRRLLGRPSHQNHLIPRTPRGGDRCMVLHRANPHPNRHALLEPVLLVHLHHLLLLLLLRVSYRCGALLRLLIARLLVGGDVLHLLLVVLLRAVHRLLLVSLGGGDARLRRGSRTLHLRLWWSGGALRPPARRRRACHVGIHRSVLFCCPRRLSYCCGALLPLPRWRRARHTGSHWAVLFHRRRRLARPLGFAAAAVRTGGSAAVGRCRFLGDGPARPAVGLGRGRRACERPLRGPGRRLILGAM